MRRTLPRFAGLAAAAVLALAMPAGAGPLGRGETLRDVPTPVQVVKAVDIARTNPGSIADMLKTLPGPDAKEAVDFLRAQKPLPPIPMDGRLNAAAMGHAQDLSRTGETSHVGSDGSTVRQRIERQGIVAPIVAEDLSVGQTSAMDVIKQLIIDRGVPGRGHRGDIYSVRYVLIGVGCAAHPKYRVVCVIDYASQPMPPPGSEAQKPPPPK